MSNLLTITLVKQSDAVEYRTEPSVAKADLHCALPNSRRIVTRQETLF